MNTQLCPTVCFPGKGLGAGNQSPTQTSVPHPSLWEGQGRGSQLGLLRERRREKTDFVTTAL